MINIKYRKVQFTLHFMQPVFFDVYPSFILRSILGKELKNLSCLMRGNRCDTCSLRFTCAYSVIFETPIQKENAVLSGRDRASHPFSIFVRKGYKEKVSDLLLEMTLIGKATDYLPYVFHAFRRAGEVGLFKDHVSFEIQELLSDGRSLFLASGDMDLYSGIHTWTFSESEDTSPGPLSLELASPLRIKAQGKYMKRFDPPSFFHSLWSRAQILSSLYGVNEGTGEYWPDKTLQTMTDNTCWVDLERWSSRQKRAMLLGGLMGEVKISGMISSLEKNLIHFGELFHVGKNTAFGLGKIRCIRKGDIDADSK